MTDLKRLKEIIADLTIENAELKTQVKEKADSLMWWYKEHDKVKTELEALKDIEVIDE